MNLSSFFLRALLVAAAIVAPVAQRAQGTTTNATPTTLTLPFNDDGESETLKVSYDGETLSLANKGVVFAEAALANVKRSAIDQTSKKLTLETTDGRRFVFSGENAARGLVTVEYAHVVEATLRNEEPLNWTLTSVDMAQEGGVKAFGTAGLRDVDGHNGSYAFLAIVAPKTRSGVVGGWLTSEKAGGVVRSSVTDGIPTMIPRLDYGAFETKGRVMAETFVVGYFDDCRKGLESYADAIADRYNISLNTKNLVGYCTWYSDKHGGASDETALLELADAAKRFFGDFGFSYIQIDCGWQLGESKNGPDKNFSQYNPDGPYKSGISATAKEIARRDFTLGLWFMPFSGNYDDPYFADKQDFFVRSAIDYPKDGEENTRRYPSINQRKGEPYETFWGGTCLDMSNPRARDYLRFITNRITQEWGCQFVKIDGTWCAGAIEQLYVNDEYVEDDIGQQLFHDANVANIENLRTGLETIRDAAKDTFILGCTVSQNMRSLAASYGVVDAMRIGPDNGADWDGVCAGPIRGTNRYFYNGRVWYNDPDPVYVRNSIPIERARVSASWTALAGQLYALGDWIPEYDPERVDVVRKTIPNHQRVNVRPVDLFDEEFPRAWILTDDASGVRRDVVGLFNWRGDDGSNFQFSPEKLELPTVDDDGKPIETYVGFDFWGDRLVEPFHTLERSLPKEACEIIAIRPLGDAPMLLSTSRHITQGILDVTKESWDRQTRTLTIEANVPNDFSYELRIYNPSSNELERFNAPKELVGHVRFQYRPDAKEDERFTAERIDKKP